MVWITKRAAAIFALSVLLSAHAVPQPLDSANSPKIPTVAQVENIAGVINPGHSLDSLDTADEEDHAPPPVQKYCLCAEPGKGLADTAATKAACGGFTKKINGSRKSPGGGAFTSCEDINEDAFTAFGNSCIKYYNHAPPGNGKEGAICCTTTGTENGGHCSLFR